MLILITRVVTLPGISDIDKGPNDNQQAVKQTKEVMKTVYHIDKENYEVVNHNSVGLSSGVEGNVFAV